jgi:hypothetical protein
MAGEMPRDYGNPRPDYQCISGTRFADPEGRYAERTQRRE